MKEVQGQYKVDGKATAAIQAGWFTERLEMKPGYEEAVEEYWQANSDAYESISLIITDSELSLRSGEESESFKILNWIEEEDGIHVIIDWDGNVDFRVFNTPDGSTLFLCNECNDISEIGWRKCS